MYDGYEKTPGTGHTEMLSKYENITEKFSAKTKTNRTTLTTQIREKREI